jgi:hypothetical protein
MPHSSDAPAYEPGDGRRDRSPPAVFTGRKWALGAGVLATLGALADLVLWSNTTQQECSGADIQFFDFVAIGRGVTIAVAVIAALAVVAAWRKAPHRVLVAVTVLLVALDLLVAVAAAVVGAGKITSCF